jgi:hypothetical protein
MDAGENSDGSSPDEWSTEPLRSLGASALAVCAVFAVIGILLAAFGESTSGGKPDPGRTSAVGTSSPAPTPTTTPRPGPPAGVTPAPTPTPRPTPSARPTSPSPRPPSPTARPTPTRTRAPAPRGRVVIFNQTVHQGLAARFGAELDDDGWTVDAVDTWRGNVPATTVYYPDGMERLARTLMDEHPEIGRIRPAFPGISRDAITVILCKDFPVGSVAAAAPGGTGTGGLAAAAA